MDAEQLSAQLGREDGVTTPLPLQAVAVTGEDAESFLQGQLTLDLDKLPADDHRLTAWCNAKGRCWALPRVFRDETDFVLLVPQDQAEAFVRRLGMFVLRARVTLQIRDLAIQGLIGPAEMPALCRENEAWRLRLGPRHSLRVAHEALEATGPAVDARFHALRLLAGEAQINAATQEKFLPQSLDLAAQDGLHFNKGCYVGQEIVARVHYRGKTPQRLRTLINPEDAALDGRILLDEVYADGHRIVQAVEHVKAG